MPSLRDQFFPKGEPKTQVEAVVVPANGSRPHIATLPLIEVAIREATIPTDKKQKEIFLKASAASAIYHYNESACDPNIRFLPNTVASGHWNPLNWQFRSVVGVRRRTKDDDPFRFTPPPPGLHLFYTISHDGIPNSTVGNVVHGDVFILKISDHLKGGLNYYADIGKGDLDLLEDLLGELIELRCKDIEDPRWCRDQGQDWAWEILGDLNKKN